jgi:hypothetical protein
MGRESKASGDFVSVELDVVTETDKAYLLTDGRSKAWIAKSLIGDMHDGTFELPYWKAHEVGFL